MQAPAPILLLTRPEAQSGRFAAAATARFGAAVRILVAPLMEIVFTAPVLPLDGVRALAFTSENGVAGFCRLSPRRDLPAYCVGARTAEAARSAGFRARSAAGDGAALARLIAAEGAAGPLLHPHGAHRQGDLAAALAGAGIALRAVEVYRQEPRSPSPAAAAVLNGQTRVIAPIFSPRSARLFRAAFAAPRAPLALVALSPAVAEALGQRPGERLLTAARPEAEAMLDAVAAAIDAGPAA